MKASLIFAILALSSSTFAADLFCKTQKTHQLIIVNEETKTLKVLDSQKQLVLDMSSLVTDTQEVAVFPNLYVTTFKDPLTQNTVIELDDEVGRIHASFKGETGIPCSYDQK